MDVLSDILRVVRLKGALFLNAQFHEPWCVVAPHQANPAPVFAPPHDHTVVCHLVVGGRCWVQLPGSEALALAAGDVLVLPRGDAHLIGSGLNHGPADARHAVSLKIPELALTRYGGEGAQTAIVCGWFSWERQIATPLMATLPRQFRSHIRQRHSGPWLESSIRYAAGEAASGRPGADAMAARLAELLFVEALRTHIESLPEQQPGWLAGLRDPQVGRSIALLHERPAHQWTVASLAQEVNMSRTVLAERFALLMDMPPMQYLTHWRLALAAHALRSGRLSLTRIAEQIGYESDAAFSRAFSRAYGMPPGAWRRKVDEAPHG
ncbi:AraC family transcriptional regulator [Polaromonas sp.]|uniref:AraC family transcriptional regulator n=1 Tax=Polaromonas sp. TaxID=1869339 RepID=UPI00326339C0